MPNENGTVIFNDKFDNMDSKNYNCFTLSGVKENSSYEIKNRLSITVNSENTIFGVYNSNKLEGHFYAEIEFENKDNVGLALIANLNGLPDAQNFTSINIYSNGDGVPSVRVIDRQCGKDNVCDCTGEVIKNNCTGRYDVTLDGRYSMPYKKIVGKLRIFRNDNTGFFHFYVKVGNTITGKWTEGWLEIGPSKDWNPSGTSFFAMPYVYAQGLQSYTNKFIGMRAVKKPKDDQNDVATGFKAINREYNWGGYFGDAAVITFDKAFSRFDEDYKFVFWDQANYEPFWHINQNTVFSYEHVESWDTNGLKGCFEPMSDRFKRWSSVRIIEDNSVRKRVHWHHILVNPDYEILAGDRNPEDLNSIGNYTGELPEVDEYYTFYPDGTGVRHILFKPKLDGKWNCTHELGEWMVITNGRYGNFPSEYIPDTVISFANLEGDVLDFSKEDLDLLWDDYQKGIAPFDEKVNKPILEKWNQLLAIQHIKGVDAFGVWNNEHNNNFIDGGSTPGLTVGVEMSWHNMRHHFGHWPVNLEHWWKIRDDSGELDYNSTFALWPQGVTHTSSCGIESLYGTDWETHYKVDKEGRRYREWTSLIGLAHNNDYTSMRDRTSTWLKPGDIKMLNAECDFIGVDYTDKTIKFKVNKTSSCSFDIKSCDGARVVNPVLKLMNWSNKDVSIEIDGNKLTCEIDYKVDTVNGDTIIWVNKCISGLSKFKIEA